MKTPALLLLALGFITVLPSCYVTPMPGYGRAHSPLSPGGRRIVPGELRPHSPYSPGGMLVLPREARRVVHRGHVYHTHRGVWYRPTGHGHVVCPRPY